MTFHINPFDPKSWGPPMVFIALVMASLYYGAKALIATISLVSLP